MTVLRFVIVGVLNTAAALVIFAVLNRIVGDYRIAGFVAVPICVLISHTTMGRLVFFERGLRTLPAFILVYVALGALNTGIIANTVDFGYTPLTGQIVALPFIAVLSYVANRFVVFRQAQ